MADQQTPPAAPVAPQSHADALEVAFADALKEQGIVKEEPKPAESPKEATPPEAPKAPEPPKGEDAPSDPLKRSFEKLAKRSEEVRQKEERLKVYEALEKAVPPHQVQALARALASGDPMALVTAAGFTYADVAKRVINDEMPAKPAAAPEPEKPQGVLPPEIQQEIAQMRAYIAQKQQEELSQRIVKALPSDKLKFLAVRPEGERAARVNAYIAQFYQQTGSLPGETFEESVAIAAEAVEAHLAKEAEFYRQVLTPGQSSAPVTPAAHGETPKTGSETAPVPKTLTNLRTSAPAGVRPEPKTREERLNAVIAEISDPSFNPR